MKNNYLDKACEIIIEPNILINVVSKRVKQLRCEKKSYVKHSEDLSLEDIALREICEKKINYKLDSRINQNKDI